MRSTLFISCAVVSAVACGYGYQTRSTEITGTPMITSGPYVGEHELPRTLRASSQAIADGVCQHENHCGRGNANCIDATVTQARQELMHWDCEPAAVRARLEECLAGLQSQSCEVNLQAGGRPICAPNAVCSKSSAKLIAPGPALARIWE